MAFEEVLGMSTFFLLLAATVTSLAHVLGRLKEKKKVMNDFTTLTSVFIVGWLSTEMLSALTQESIHQMVSFAHFFVLVTFALVLTLRWRWALKEAMELAEGEAQ